MSVSKNNLDQAIAAAREAFREGEPDWNMLRAGVNLLAALDAARGEAVATVQTITSLVGETRKCIIGPAEVIDSLPVGTAVYAAPPAPEQRSCETATSAVPDGGFAIVPADALREVIRISDRSHPAWDAVKAAMLATAERKGE